MNRELNPPQADRPRGYAAGGQSGVAPRPARNLYSRLTASDAETGIDFAAMLTAIRMRRWLVGFCAMAGLALAGLWLGLVTPLYPATSSVLLETRQEQVIDIESVVSGLSGDLLAINTESEVLRSRKLLERLVADLRLEEDPEFNPFRRKPPAWSLSAPARQVWNLIGGGNPFQQPEPAPGQERIATVSTLRERIRIDNLDGTYVFELTIATQDPAKSARIANRLADLYILEQLEGKFEATQAATGWLSGRVADLKLALEAAEAEVEAYKSATPLVDELQLAEEARKLKELRVRAEAYRDEAAEAAARLERLAGLTASGDRRAIAAELGSPRLERMAAELQGIAGDTPGLGTGAAVEPGATQTRARQRRALLEQQFGAELDRQRAQLQLQQQRAASQAEASIPAIAEFEAAIERQGEDLVVLRQLTREAEASRLIYEHFLSRMKEISVQEGVQQADARVLSAATPALDPSFPKPGQTLGLALVLGLLLGSGAAIWIESRISRFRSAEELEKATGLPVLGQMPLAPTRRRRQLLSYVARKPASALAEAMRNLRTSLFLAEPLGRPRVIIAASSVPGEGKTTLSVLLAHNLAELGKRVLLVECDLRKQTLNAYFDGTSARSGVVSVLASGQSLTEAVQNAAPGLDFLGGEASRTNPADLLCSERFERFLDEARESYDYVILDTPPVLAVPDARMIAARADGLLYCVAWDRTGREAVLAGLNAFRGIEVPLVGLVLTQVDMPKAGRYGYGAYTAAGKGYYAN